MIVCLFFVSLERWKCFISLWNKIEVLLSFRNFLLCKATMVFMKSIHTLFRYPFPRIKADSLFFCVPLYALSYVALGELTSFAASNILVCDCLDRIERLEIFDEFEEWYMMQVSFYHPFCIWLQKLFSVFAWNGVTLSIPLWK